MFGDGKYEAQNRYDEWNTTQVKLKLDYHFYHFYMIDYQAR